MADLQDHHVAPQETKIQEHRLIVALKNAGLFDPVERIADIIHNMQAQTAVGGWNLIVSAMETEGANVPSVLQFLFKPNQLRELYADWDIVKYNEDEGSLHRTDANGNHIRMKFATMWARKRA